jgi:hypothetical protein
VEEVEQMYFHRPVTLEAPVAQAVADPMALQQELEEPETKEATPQQKDLMAVELPVPTLALVEVEQVELEKLVLQQLTLVIPVPVAREQVLIQLG